MSHEVSRKASEITQSLYELIVVSSCNWRIGEGKWNWEEGIERKEWAKYIYSIIVSKHWRQTSENILSSLLVALLAARLHFALPILALLLDSMILFDVHRLLFRWFVLVCFTGSLSKPTWAKVVVKCRKTEKVGISVSLSSHETRVSAVEI